MCVRTQEQVLVDSLFKDYNPAVRPVCNFSEAVQVELGLKVSKLDGLVRHYRTPGAITVMVIGVIVHPGTKRGINFATRLLCRNSCFHLFLAVI